MPCWGYQLVLLNRSFPEQNIRDFLISEDEIGFADWIELNWVNRKKCHHIKKNTGKWKIVIMCGCRLVFHYINWWNGGKPQENRRKLSSTHIQMIYFRFSAQYNQCLCIIYFFTVSYFKNGTLLKANSCLNKKSKASSIIINFSAQSIENVLKSSYWHLHPLSPGNRVSYPSVIFTVVGIQSKISIEPTIVLELWCTKVKPLF